MWHFLTVVREGLTEVRTLVSGGDTAVQKREDSRALSGVNLRILGEARGDLSRGSQVGGTLTSATDSAQESGG